MDATQGARPIATNTQEPEDVVQRFLAMVYNGHRPCAAAEFLSDDAVIQNGMHSWDGSEEYQTYVEPAFEAFPNYSLTIEDLFAADDSVAFRFTDSGTREGKFQGREPTGEDFSLSVIRIATVQDGTITELRYEYDRLQMMQQLGLLPESG